jgi:hypothetical protein
MSKLVQERSAIIDLPKYSLGNLQELNLGVLEENLLIGFKTDQGYHSFSLNKYGCRRFKNSINLPITVDYQLICSTYL